MTVRDLIDLLEEQPDYYPVAATGVVVITENGVRTVHVVPE